MSISYNTRLKLRRTARLLAVGAVFALVAVLCWVLWLQRYIVYTRDGAVLDFGLSQQAPPGIRGEPLPPGPSVGVQFGQGSNFPGESAGLQKLTGYYVTADDLLEDLEAVEADILALPGGTPVMLEVKGKWGYYYYPTAVGPTTSSSFDMAVMERFFAAVNKAGLYTIAKLPAFRDYDYALKNQKWGLAMPQGYLYADSDRVYWLDPSEDGVLTYLIQVAKELQSLGFDEVVFQDFCFPDSDKFVFSGDKAEAIAKAAKTILTACGSDDFVVSFSTADPNFQLPEGNCRLYLQNVAAADVEQVLSQYRMEDKDERIVLVAPSNDTRFDVHGVLRPLALVP